MKAYLTALPALLLLCSPVNAQEPELELHPLPTESHPAPVPEGDGRENTEKPEKRAAWQLGITAGYLHSTVDWVASGTDIGYTARDHIRSHPGFTVGFSASYPFADVWSVDTGVSLSMWGFGYRSGEISLRSDRYVAEIPLLITFFESDAYLPVFIQAGVIGGFTAGGINKVAVSDPQRPWEHRRAWDSFGKFSFGLVIGIGYGPFTFQFIQNITDVWSEDMSRRWEEYTGHTITMQTPKAYTLTYTHWF